MERVLLTGGTGFVGANLVRRLLADRHEIHLIVRQPRTAWRIADVAHKLHLHVADIADSRSVSDVFNEIRPDSVFHLAAYGAYSSQTDLDRMVRTNILGTMNLVRASVDVGAETFVNVGSSSEYGFKDHAPSENEWVEPNSHYAITKVCATQFCRYTAQSTGINIVTLRLYSVYGPFEEPSRLIPRLLVLGLSGELPPLVSADIARDFVFVDDVCEAFVLAATSRPAVTGAVYNVGTGYQVRLSELVDLARKILAIPVVPEWGTMPARAWDSTCWIADSRRLQHDLGWKPQFSLERGLRATLSWLQRYPQFATRYAEWSAAP